MKKTRIIVALALCLSLCSCSSVQASMADAIEEMYGEEGKTYEEHKAYYQAEWDALFDGIKYLFEFGANELEEEFVQQLESAAETEAEAEPEKLFPDNTVPTFTDSKKNVIPINNYVDENGHIVPILYNFPNAENKNVSLSEYPNGTKFPYSQSMPLIINGVEYPSVYDELGAHQCFGYALYVQRKLYNADEKKNSEKFTNVPGSAVAPGTLTVDKCKELITEAGPGAHIRTKSKQHSMVIAYVDDNGFAVIDSNGTSELYVNDIRYYTWEEYATKPNGYGSRGFEYIKKYSP